MVSRREFLKITGTVAGTAAASLTGVDAAFGSGGPHLDPDRIGVLTDLTLCIGCRRCEWACAEQNDLPHGPLSDCDDQSVFAHMRAPRRRALHRGQPLRRPARERATRWSVKVQCMHCERPACVSACIVGALEKDPRGPVTYDSWECIGCRYCMVACPFQIPAYEYDKQLTPKVMKCTICFERTLEQGQRPACVEMCPPEALVYGKRTRAARTGPQPDQERPRPLPRPRLRRARSRRHRVADDRRPSRRAVRPAGPARPGPARDHRDHPARHLQGIHRPGDALRTPERPDEVHRRQAAATRRTRMSNSHTSGTAAMPSPRPGRRRSAPPPITNMPRRCRPNAPVPFFTPGPWC